jgi:hypothetical protein
MQSEQQISTQTKKSTTVVKKDKKVKTKETEEQSTVQQVEQSPAPVVVLAPAPVVVQTAAPVVAPSTELEPTTDVAVVQEFDISAVLEFLNSSSDKFTENSKFFKDATLTKDERNKIDLSLKKFAKASSAFSSSYTEYLAKQVSLLEKNSGSKSGGVKKVQDKEKSAIHKKLTVHPFLLSFMKLEPGTLVSRSDALTAITGFVKQEKVKNPEIIVADDKRSFKLLGDLKTLFGGIEGIMVSKGMIAEKQMPLQIKYTQIMQYMTHCFIKTEGTTDATVV